MNIANTHQNNAIRSLETESDTVRPGVNAAFLQEIKDDEHVVNELIVVITEIVTSDSVSVSRTNEVLTLLRRLYAQLSFRFQLEELVGYMDDVVECAPRLCNRAESLLSEHATILLQLRRVTEYAHDGLQDLGDPQPERTIGRVREQFAAFAAQLSVHEEAEDDLITEALYFDIGGSE